MKSLIMTTALMMSLSAYGATTEIYGKVTTIIASDSTIYGWMYGAH